MAGPTLPIASYNPGDWPQTYGQESSNEAAFVASKATELSDTVQTPIATQATNYSAEWASKVGLQQAQDSALITQDIQGKQAAATPYVENHLYM